MLDAQWHWVDLSYSYHSADLEDCDIVSVAFQSAFHVHVHFIAFCVPRVLVYSLIVRLTLSQSKFEAECARRSGVLACVLPMWSRGGRGRSQSWALFTSPSTKAHASLGKTTPPPHWTTVSYHFSIAVTLHCSLEKLLSRLTMQLFESSSAF